VKKKKKTFLGNLPVVSLVVAGLALVPTAAFATCFTDNLLTNPGFECGVVTSGANADVPAGWTSNAAFDTYAGFNGERNTPTIPVHSGSAALAIGNYDTDPLPTLSQTFSDTATTTYTVSFFLNYGGGAKGDAGALFYAQINGAPLLTLTESVGSAYTLESFTFKGTGSDTLTFAGNTDPSEWFVDDASVKGPTAVPLPPSEALLLSALAGLGFVAYRRCKKGPSAFAIA
jgi:hypothetical protein